MIVPYSFAHDADSRKALLETVVIEERLDHQLPLDLAFTDESGTRVPLRHYFDGRPVLLAFVYFDCPQLCPLVLEGLARSLRVLRLAGADYRVLAVSIDPAEKPALAGQKKAALRPTGEWHFLTGTAEAIAALTDAAGFRYRARAVDGKTEFMHAANTTVITPSGRISRYFSSIDFPPKDLRLALIEASGNRIGSPLDRLLMLCYRYDPAQGRYTLAILSVLRLAAVATVAGIAIIIGILLLRERQRRAHSASRSESSV